MDDESLMIYDYNFVNVDFLRQYPRERTRSNISITRATPSEF